MRLRFRRSAQSQALNSSRSVNPYTSMQNFSVTPMKQQQPCANCRLLSSGAGYNQAYSQLQRAQLYKPMTTGEGRSAH